MLILLMAFIGVATGGLVNLVADSIPVHREIRSPHCQACSAPRPVSAYLGLTAWLFGSWRCSYCHHQMPIRHSLVELILGIAAVSLHITGVGLLGVGASFIVFSIFVLISVTDIEHRLIPHVISLPAILLVAGLAAFDPDRGVTRTLLGGLAGFGIVLLLFLFGELYSRWQAGRRGEPLEEVAFGFGDVTLATLIGVSVGWPAVVLALMVGVLSAGAFSLFYLLWMVLRGQYRPHLPIPYGPFLIFGALLVFFGGQDLFRSLLLN